MTFDNPTLDNIADAIGDVIPDGLTERESATIHIYISLLLGHKVDSVCAYHRITASEAYSLNHSGAPRNSGCTEENRLIIERARQIVQERKALA